MMTNHIYNTVCSHIDKFQIKKKIIVFTDCTDVAFSEIHYKTIERIRDKRDIQLSDSSNGCCKEFFCDQRCFFNKTDG